MTGLITEKRAQAGSGEPGGLAALAAIAVGHPADPATVMGPLATLGQREDVRTAVTKLAATARLTYADPDHVDTHGTDATRQAFLSPIPLSCDDAAAAAPHEIETFGPVSTVIPYKDLQEAVTLTARAAGSLAGSIVTADADVGGDFIMGLAPWHGRLPILNREDAAESTGYGVAMPQTMHGGPGRAGGGAELGGLRALDHYLQRTALQAHPRTLP